jgi:thiamine-phosphate pyrophosphorylase
MDKTIRILDANVNRSREGLRVTEDIVRFVLDDAELASKIKNIRHEVTSLIRQLPLDELEFLRSRDSQNDVGMNLNCASEDLRVDILQIATANMHRSQEAARVLEEVSKLYDPKVALGFKKLRFQVYGLEKQIMPRLMECHPMKE